MEIKNRKILDTDILIIGGGTAGCYAALTIAEQSDAKVIIAEKANIKRSGCLAAGVNAINAYIVEGRKPEDYVDYAKKDADGIVREDLLLTMSEGLTRVTEKMEKLGLVILKDENGKYVARGNRNIKINGENIKPLLASAVEALPNVTILNRVAITDYLVKENRIYGAVGFSIEDETAVEIRAKKVLCATGGASGLYRPNNPGFSRHKMWYPPFNTGAGYAMGIESGAEMTTFEMRFIALRCKDTIAPTGTIAQGVGAKQVNALGEVYETKYGLTTSQRVYGTVKENLLGHGPCYLRTEGISAEQDDSLKKAYLNMAPSQTLKWIESGKMPKFSLCDDGIAWFQSKGKWKSRGYSPAPGTLIFFDWNGDGTSDHVGIVVGTKWPFVKVIEGNRDDAVAYRVIPLGEIHIRGYGLPDYASEKFAHYDLSYAGGRPLFATVGSFENRKGQDIF